MVYKNIEEFYLNNKDELLGDHGKYRPVKSITRNIFNSVDNFYNWYFSNSRKTITYKEICEEVCHVNDETGRSTIIDNIRNMKELKFLAEDPTDSSLYHFTRNFINYVMNGEDLTETIIKNLKEIGCIEQMTMFYNYILCTLREGYINGFITLYPDSEEEFKNTVENKNERIDILNNIYQIYGFHGNSREPKDDNYTPNINYRILSTVKQLNLIEESIRNQYGLQTYSLSILGKEVLNQIELNFEIRKKGKVAIDSYERSEKFIEAAIQMNPTDTSIQNIKEELQEIIYELKSEECCPSLILDESIDKPLPISTISVSYDRDPQKAANAKAMANYTCEFDHMHKTFINEASNNQYVEAHHLIPISKQDEFDFGIDVEANIIALCPTCHRRIHNAIPNQKLDMIKELYQNRIDRINKCGINLSFNKLCDIYNVDQDLNIEDDKTNDTIPFYYDFSSQPMMVAEDDISSKYGKEQDDEENK